MIYNKYLFNRKLRKSYENFLEKVEALGKKLGDIEIDFEKDQSKKK